MTKPKHMYVPTEEQTGNQVRTPAQLEALAKGRARYMEKVNARKEAGKKENGEEEEREEKEVDAEVDEPPEPEESPSPPPSPPPEPEEPEPVPEKPAPPPREPSPPPRPASPPPRPASPPPPPPPKERLGHTASARKTRLKLISYMTNPIIVLVIPTRPYFRIAGVPSLENSLIDRTSESDGHSTHENHFSQLYICSDTLGTDSMLCNNDTAVPTNILACVMNDQPKFSYLNFQTNTPAWNKLNDTKIQEFDIKIRDHRDRDIPTENLPNFNMTLVFETIDEIDYQKEHTKEYLREAYRKEHNYRK
ncbi:unnamed protein product [Bathycoccus prasinos]